MIRLDDVSRALLLPGGACVEDTVRIFGQEIVREDGTLDRAKIAAVIFQDEEKRKALDALIHPAVKAETIRLQKEAEEEGVRYLVIEAALLLEEKYNAICSEVWYIYADIATRYSRLESSRGYSKERIAGMMASQLSEETFRSSCDFTIDNSGSEQETHAAVDCRMAELAAV